MKKLIFFLLSGCWHKWKVIDIQPVEYTTISERKKRIRRGTIYTLQCTRCGEITKKKVSYR